LLYIDLHSSDYPAGEIRGQFLASVAEPTNLVPAATALALGLLGYAWRRRTRSR
jgi:MYXO-CTERM domain-containing protein